MWVLAWVWGPGLRSQLRHRNSPECEACGRPHTVPVSTGAGVEGHPHPASPTAHSPSASAFPGRGLEPGTSTKAGPWESQAHQEPPVAQGVQTQKWLRARGPGPHCGVVVLSTGLADTVSFQRSGAELAGPRQMLESCPLPQVGMGPAVDRGPRGPRGLGGVVGVLSWPLRVGLGAGASFTSDHVAGEGQGWRPRPRQAVGGHLLSTPSCPAASGCFLSDDAPGGEVPSLLPTTSPGLELLPTSGPTRGLS